MERFHERFRGAVVDEVFQHIIMGVFFWGGEIFIFWGEITSLQITLHCNVPFFLGGIFDSGGNSPPPPEMPGNNTAFVRIGLGSYRKKELGRKKKSKKTLADKFTNEC